MCHFYSLVYIPAEVVSDANALRFQQWSADTDFLTRTCSLQAHPTAQIYFSKMRECGSEAGENKIQSDSFITHSVFMWLCFYSIIVFTLKYNVPTPVGPTCCCGRWDGGAGCIRILWQGTWLKKHPLFSCVVARVKVLAQRNSTKQWILYMFNLLRAPVPLWSSGRLTPHFPLLRCFSQESSLLPLETFPWNVTSILCSSVLGWLSIFDCCQMEPEVEPSSKLSVLAKSLQDF